MRHVPDSQGTEAKARSPHGDVARAPSDPATSPPREPSPEQQLEMHRDSRSRGVTLASRSRRNPNRRTCERPKRPTTPNAVQRQAPGLGAQPGTARGWRGERSGSHHREEPDTARPTARPQATQTPAPRMDAQGGGGPETRRLVWAAASGWQLRGACLFSIMFYYVFLCTVKTNVTL